MNQTRTTTLRRHPLARRLRRVLHLHHAALVLVALVAASCAADPFDGRQPDDATDPDVLTFAVAPRPAFTEAAVSGQGTAAPATRATQTPGATQWEQGDILWLSVAFYQDKQNPTAPDAGYTSALKYDGAEWRYLTVAEAEELNTGNLPNFSRLVRWPRGWKDWVDPVMFIAAYYAGSGTPDADGTLTINPTGEIPTTPLIVGRSGICSPDVQPVPLKFMYESISRVRIPAGCKVELTHAEYWSTIGFSLNSDTDVNPEPITEIPAQSEDTDVFLRLIVDAPTAKLTRDGVSPCTFTFPPITYAEGYITRDGASYTLTPYTSGTETPVADYDLTIADEAGLRAFAQAVNAGEKLPNGKPAAEARVLQTADITLTAEWVPIGYAKRFRGAYNGNGHTITDLTITTPPADADGYIFAGLFGYAGEAVLTGINLRAVEINIRAGSSTPTLYAGSIVGQIYNSTLSLCSADGTVNANGGAKFVYAGGIAGMINAVAEGAVTISRCRADAGITAATTHADGFAYAGGIAGTNSGYGFILCCETGSKPVTAGAGGTACAGGITGWNIVSLIAFCRTGTNAVTAQNGTDVNLAGGLVGQNVGYLYSCYSRAEATATGSGGKRAGAIVGNNDVLQGDVQHCYAAGAANQGSSNLATGIGIVYKAIPDPGEIFGVMTNYPGEVESLTGGGKTYYPFTTSYAPSATPAYGIIPLRTVWKSDGAWNIGDGTYPKLNIYEYEGRE